MASLLRSHRQQFTRTSAHATGDCDYVVRLHCRDTADLHQTLRALKADLGAHTRTRVILEESVRARQRLP
jgi:hypothetical protein